MSWKLFLHTAQREMAELRGTDTSEAAGEAWATPAPQLRMRCYLWQKSPHLTGTAAGGNQAEQRGCQRHRDILKKVEATSKEQKRA